MYCACRLLAGTTIHQTPLCPVRTVAFQRYWRTVEIEGLTGTWSKLPPTTQSCLPGSELSLSPLVCWNGHFDSKQSSCFIRQGRHFLRSKLITVFCQNKRPMQVLDTAIWSYGNLVYQCQKRKPYLQDNNILVLVKWESIRNQDLTLVWFLFKISLTCRFLGFLNISNEKGKRVTSKKKGNLE